MNVKKFYLTKNEIFEVVLIPLEDLPIFKTRYEAILNKQLIKHKHRKVYDLNNGRVLEEIYEQGMMCTKECLQALYNYFEQNKNSKGRSLSVDENFLSNINNLIQELADFMKVDTTILNKTPESMKIVSDFFEGFVLDGWLAQDVYQSVIAYFGEIIRQKYPQSKWQIEHNYDKSTYQPYILVNNRIREDFFLDRYKYLAGVVEEWGITSLYDRLIGSFNYIDSKLKDK